MNSVTLYVSSVQTFFIVLAGQFSVYVARGLLVELPGAINSGRGGRGGDVENR